MWNETHGIWQTNKMLHDSKEVEYKVFMSADKTDGLLEDWKPQGRLSRHRR